MNNLNILIADAFPESHQHALRQAGHDLSVDPSLEGAPLRHALGETAAEVLVVRSTRVDAATLDTATANGGKLKLVIRAGAGTNTIDKAHAASKGVRVCNVPGANSAAVAELTLGLMLAIDRRIADNVNDLRNRRWNKKLYGQARGLHGQRLAIFGLGAIGLAVARRGYAFGMRVSALAKASRSEAARDAIRAYSITEVASREALLGDSDIVTLHLPLTAATERLVDDAFLAEMQEGAMLVNTSRGELVDEAALIRALDAKGIRAGLDVYRDEPSSGEGEFTSALANHPRVCGTHHIGASTEQAQAAVADGVVRVVESFTAGELLHCVND